MVRVAAWDPRVLSSSPVGRWINTPGGWISQSSFRGRRNEYQCTGKGDTASATQSRFQEMIATPTDKLPYARRRSRLKKPKRNKACQQTLNVNVLLAQKEHFLRCSVENGVKQLKKCTKNAEAYIEIWYSQIKSVINGLQKKSFRVIFALTMWYFYI